MSWGDDEEHYVAPPKPKTRVGDEMFPSLLAEKLDALDGVFKPHFKLVDTCKWVKESQEINPHFTALQLKKYRTFLKRKRGKSLLVWKPESIPDLRFLSPWQNTLSQRTMSTHKAIQIMPGRPSLDVHYMKWTKTTFDTTLTPNNDLMWINACELPTPSEMKALVFRSFSWRFETNTELVLIDRPRPDGKNLVLPVGQKTCAVACALTWAYALWSVGLPWEAEYKQLMSIGAEAKVAAAVKAKSWDCMQQLLCDKIVYPNLTDWKLSILYRSARALPKPPKSEDPFSLIGHMCRRPRADHYSGQAVYDVLEREMTRKFRIPRESVCSSGATMEYTRAEGGFNRAVATLSKPVLSIEGKDFAETLVTGSVKTEIQYLEAVKNALRVFRHVTRPAVATVLDIPERGYKHRVPVMVESLAAILGSYLGIYGRRIISAYFGATFRDQDFTMKKAAFFLSGDYESASDRLPWAPCRAVYNWVINLFDIPDKEIWYSVVDWLIGPYNVYEGREARCYYKSIWEHLTPEIDSGIAPNDLQKPLYNQFRNLSRIAGKSIHDAPLLEFVKEGQIGTLFRTVRRVVMTPQILAERLSQRAPFEYRTTKAGVMMSLGLTQLCLYILNWLPHMGRTSQFKLLGDDNVSSYRNRQEAEDVENAKRQNGMDISKTKTIFSSKGYTIAQQIYLKKVGPTGSITMEQVPFFTMRQVIIHDRELNDYVNKPRAAFEKCGEFPEEFRWRVMSLLYSQLRHDIEQLVQAGCDVFHPKHGLFPRLFRRKPVVTPDSLAVWLPSVRNPVDLEPLRTQWEDLIAPDTPFNWLGVPSAKTADITPEKLMGLFTKVYGGAYQAKPSGQMPYRIADYKRRMRLASPLATLFEADYPDGFKPKEPSFEYSVNELPEERITTNIVDRIQNPFVDLVPGIPLSRVICDNILHIDYSNLGEKASNSLVAESEMDVVYVYKDGAGDEGGFEWVIGTRTILIILLFGNSDRNMLGMLKWYKRKGYPNLRHWLCTKDKALKRQWLIKKGKLFISTAWVKTTQALYEKMFASVLPQPKRIPPVVRKQLDQLIFAGNAKDEVILACEEIDAQDFSERLVESNPPPTLHPTLETIPVDRQPPMHLSAQKEAMLAWFKGMVKEHSVFEPCATEEHLQLITANTPISQLNQFRYDYSNRDLNDWNVADLFVRELSTFLSFAKPAPKPPPVETEPIPHARMKERSFEQEEEEDEDLSPITPTPPSQIVVAGFTDTPSLFYPSPDIHGLPKTLGQYNFEINFGDLPIDELLHFTDCVIGGELSGKLALVNGKVRVRGYNYKRNKIDFIVNAQKWLVFKRGCTALIFVEDPDAGRPTIFVTHRPDYDRLKAIVDPDPANTAPRERSMREHWKKGSSTLPKQ